MNSQKNWPRNRLLLALPSSDLHKLMPELEQIRCEREQILMDADSSLDQVYFPNSGVVSAVAVYADGTIIEMATIGREGCTAVQAILGAESSSIRLLVQLPGGAAKMSRAAFTQAMGEMPSFRNLMYAYVQAFLEQVLVSVACNGAHSLKQRLARWLLMMRDRSDDDALQITQAARQYQPSLQDDGLRPKFTPPALGPILFEDVGDDFFRNRRLRCEKKVIDNSIVVPHWQRVGNEFKPSDSFEALLKRLHDRRVILFDKFPLEKKVAQVAFDISSFTP